MREEREKRQKEMSAQKTASERKEKVVVEVPSASRKRNMHSREKTMVHVNTEEYPETPKATRKQMETPQTLTLSSGELSKKRDIYKANK